MLELTGATRAQAIHWKNLGIIRADIQESTGTGVPNLYSFRNLIEIRVAVELVARFKVVHAPLAVLLQYVRDAMETKAEFVWFSRLDRNYLPPEAKKVLDSGGEIGVLALLERPPYCISGKREELWQEIMVGAQELGDLTGIVVDLGAVERHLRSKGATE